MLDIWKETHLDYGKIVQPPDGFHLKRAIGSTYSVDPSCLLLIPVAMLYSRPMESELITDVTRYDVLNAITESAKVITLFHQKNKIHLPKRVSKLLHYTEGCLAGVNPDNHLSSFHPKCWFLIFENQKTKQRRTRFVITSRNLTFDQSWDTAFNMEGDVTDRAIEKNRPFVDFLEFLEEKSGKQIESWVKVDILKTKFIVNLPFLDWNFWPIGIGKGYDHPFSKRSFRSDHLLMMSPFVDDEMVHQISMKAAKSSWLFTRKDALEKLKVETFKNATPAEYFCINERLREGQLDERVVQNNEVLSTNDSDLHAKLYINQSGNKVFWFLGSANLSAPAFGRNTECLIELTSNDRSVFPLAIKNQLVSTDDKHKLFEKVDISRLEVIPADNFLNNHLRKLEFDLADCKISGKCNRIEGVTDQYRYDIKIDTRGKDWLPAFSVGIKPLFMQKTDSLGFIVNPGGFEPVNISETFPLTQLSRYFIFSISYKDDESLKKQFLLLGDIEVPKSRLAMVFSEVIDSTDKFLKFLMSVLNENEVIDSPTDTITSSSSAGNMEKYRNSAALLYEVPLYEHLLRTVSRNPFKLKSVEEAIMRIQEDKDSQHVIPVEFMEMWNVFKPFIQNDK